MFTDKNVGKKIAQFDGRYFLIDEVLKLYMYVNGIY